MPAQKITTNERSEIMAFDYSKLDGKITEICKTRGNFAAAMGISEHTISAKKESTDE